MSLEEDMGSSDFHIDDLSVLVREFSQVGNY